MKYLYPIIALSLLLLSCSEEKEEPNGVNIEVASTDSLLPEHDRPSIDTLNEFMEISDTILIEEKIFRYSIFLPKTFDTVFKQPYGSCTYSSMRTVFTNQNYLTESHISTFMHQMWADDTLYYIAVSADTMSTQIINDAYRNDQHLRRKAALTASKSKTVSDTSYLVARNDYTRLISERINANRSTHTDLQFLLEGVLFEVNTAYLGKLAKAKFKDLKVMVESFEVERL
jgi:hypothetical protein